ncbi:MAG: type II toxin-antitoxin system death-on-curing family toxin [Gemmatimonadaceae bacterium]
MTEPALLALHAQQIERYGGAHGVRDQNVVLSTLARPANLRAYDPSADLAELVAAYLVGFVQSQGFDDGNKRTGLATALVFLLLNGSPLHVPPPELYALTTTVTTGKADDAVVAAYIRDRLGRGSHV